MTKLFIGIDYHSRKDEMATYEIFDSITKARQFKEKLDKKDKKSFIRAFVADVNNYFYEKDIKGWNYDDFNNTIESTIIIKL